MNKNAEKNREQNSHNKICSFTKRKQERFLEMKVSKCNDYCHVPNNIGFPEKRKLGRSNSVLICMRFEIYLYVAAQAFTVNF